MATSPSPASTLREQTTIQRKEELRSDILTIRGQIEDGIVMGNSMFGQYAHADVASEVSDRLNQLKKQKEELGKDIRQKEALIERSNRDFSDVKETLPPTQERQRVRFMEDYTVMFLSISYVFMVISAIVYTVSLSPTPWPTLFKSLGYSAGGTVFVGLLFYMIA